MKHGIYIVVQIFGGYLKIVEVKYPVSFNIIVEYVVPSLVVWLA